MKPSNFKGKVEREREREILVRGQTKTAYFEKSVDTCTAARSFLIDRHYLYLSVLSLSQVTHAHHRCFDATFVLFVSLCVHVVACMVLNPPTPPASREYKFIIFSLKVKKYYFDCRLIILLDQITLINKTIRG